MASIEEQTMALAGMFQSASLIDQLAHRGEINQAAFDCCVDSLFTFQASSVIDVYGNLAGLHKGFQSLIDYLSGRNSDNGKAVAYYIMSMMKLSRNLLHDDMLSTRLQENLQTIQQQSTDFEMSRNSLINKIDGLYQQTISQLQPRIIVKGEQSFLTNSDNAAKVRALLFSGIRSAVLWHQIGGSKWKLLISRQKFVNCAKRLMSEF